MCVIVKARCFYDLLLIHNQNQKNQCSILDISTKKKSLQNLMISWWIFWIGYLRMFYKSFFVKNFYLDLIFFLKHCRVLYLKTRVFSKVFSKRIKVTKKLLDSWYKAKHWKKRVKKWKMRKNQTTAYCFYFFI